jgi:hypothetical protein
MIPMLEYLLSVHLTAENPTGNYLSEEDMQEAFAAVDVFNAELQEKGAWVFAGGLQMPDTATVVDATGAEVVVTDGPYSETKEQIGGFWVIACNDLDEALAWAAKGSAACKGAVEVRPFQGLPE